MGLLGQRKGFRDDESEPGSGRGCLPPGSSRPGLAKGEFRGSRSREIHDALLGYRGRDVVEHTLSAATLAALTGATAAILSFALGYWQFEPLVADGGQWRHSATLPRRASAPIPY